jgi:hypothetical protein
MGTSITGTSAVNAEGEVLVFCEGPYCDLSYFEIGDGQDMRFYTGDDRPRFEAVFGKLTVETASVRGNVVVCFPGSPERYARVPIRYGL